tara:strand:+ start:127 stop:1149 length:1023 start_codon:yes stop_codon:yes gene_type:complete
LYRPVIDNENINYNNLIVFLKSSFNKVIKLPLLAVAIVVVYFIFFKTPSYSAKVSFYTDYKKVAESSMFTPFIGALAGSESLNFSIDNYIASDKFLEEISLKIYNINGTKQSLVDFWSKDYDKVFSLNPLEFIKKIDERYMLNKNLSIEQRKLSFTKKKLKSSISHKEERLSNLHTIKVTVRRNGSLPTQIASAIYSSTISYSNEITNTKAIEKRNFINDRVAQVRKDLENYENEMIIFLNNNKNLDSPNLLVQRGRIERNIILHTQLLANLSDQLELSKIDAKDSTSSMFLLDKAAVSNIKAGIAPLRAVITIFITVFLVSLSVECYRNRNELFIFNRT